jgi:hypothetical protein
MLHTCVASTDVYLTSTQALKDLLGITTTSEDRRLSQAILAASRWAENYVGRPLTVASYQETVPSFETRHLMLSRMPVRAVPRVFDSSSTEDGSQVYSSDFRVESRDGGLLSRDEGWAWTAPVQSELSVRPLPGQEERPWLVDYVAGYTYDGLSTDSPHWSTEQGTTSTGRTLPEDIEEAVLMRASEIFENPGGGVEKEKLGDIEVAYGSRGMDRAGNPVLTPAEELLSAYRSWV